MVQALPLNPDIHRGDKLHMWRRTLKYLIIAGLLLPLVAAAGSPDRGGQQDERSEHRGVTPGTLVTPGRDQPSRKSAQDRQCMKVCIRWGEDCIIDNRGVRRCQRSCQEFGEQCF